MPGTFLGAILAAAAIMMLGYAGSLLIRGNSDERMRKVAERSAPRGPAAIRTTQTDASAHGKGKGSRSRLLNAEALLPGILGNLQHRAGDTTTPHLWALGVVAVAAVLSVLLWVAFGSPLLIVAGIGGGIAFPFTYLGIRAGKRVAAIEEQVSAASLRLAHALAGGATPMRALEEVAADFPAPLGDELRYVYAKVENGWPLENALGDLPKLLPSADSLAMMVAYIRMALALGGNLGSQLEEVARIVQRRRTDTARVMAATAQLRGEILILSFVPIVLYLMLHGTLQPLLSKYYAPWEVAALVLGGGIAAYTFSSATLRQATKGLV